MAKIRILTDSVADIPPEIVKELGITVIPLLLRFGEEVYRDGVDITADEFYKKLATSKVMPVTSVPAPATFAEAYDKLAEEADGIVAIILSSKLSGTHDVARQATGLMTRKCRVEVIDSLTATMAQGFLVIEAARAVREGAGMAEVLAGVKRNMKRVDFRAAFDTLEYLRRGGRIGRAQAFLGSMLKINPIITLKDGLVIPAGRTHSRAKAIDCLYQFATSFSNVEALAVESTGASPDAEELVSRLSGSFPGEKIYRSKMTPAVGTHCGPGMLLVAVLGDR